MIIIIITIFGTFFEFQTKEKQGQNQVGIQTASSFPFSSKLGCAQPPGAKIEEKSGFAAKRRRVGPRWPQDGDRMAQDGPKMPQDGPGWPQDGPKVPQDGPRWLQDGLKMAQKRAKWGEHDIQMRPKWTYDVEMSYITQMYVFLQENLRSRR